MNYFDNERVGTKDNSFDIKLDSVKNFVKETYSKSHCPKEQIDSFNLHNDTVYSYAMKLAKEEGITERNLQELQLAVCLHDVSKCDDGDSFQVFIKHGLNGAIVTLDLLGKLNFDEQTIDNVANAIERHMGPIPGFMENAAKNWEGISGQKINFPRPQTIVDKLLYDADMLSLIDKKGIEKILVVRENDKHTKEKDSQVSKELGISIKEASWISALQSAREAYESLYTEAGRRKGKELLEKACDNYNEFKKGTD